MRVDDTDEFVVRIHKGLNLLFHAGFVHRDADRQRLIICSLGFQIERNPLNGAIDLVGLADYFQAVNTEFRAFRGRQHSRARTGARGGTAEFQDGQRSLASFNRRLVRNRHRNIAAGARFATGQYKPRAVLIRDDRGANAHLLTARIDSITQTRKRIIVFINGDGERLRGCLSGCHSGYA